MTGTGSSMWGLRSGRTVTIGLAFAAFAVICLAPVAYMVATAVAELPRVAAGILSDPRQQSLLRNSVGIGVGTAALATLVGVPLGFVLARGQLLLTPLLRIALTAPALLPPYVVALAWTGLPAAILWTDASAPFAWTYSAVGVVIVLAVVCFPIPMLVTEVALRHVDGRLEDAAVLIASRRRTLLRITLPLIAPAIVSASLIVLVLAMSDFAVPGLLRVRVFTTEVFTAFAALYDFGRATALALPIVLIASACSVLAVLLARGHVAGRGTARRSGVMTFEEWRPLFVAAVALAFGITVVLPVFVLAVDAMRATTFDDVFRGSVAAILNTVLLAAAGASVVTVLAALLGYARSRSAYAVAGALDALWVALFCVPSTVVGIGLISLWNRSGVPAIYGTATMVVFGYVARLLPVSTLIVGAVMSTIPRSHEEAAAAAGATWGRAMMSVLIPQARAALMATWVFAFVLAAGEVGTTILVAPPGESTLPIRVYTLVANAPPGRLSGLALLQSVVVLIPVALVGMVVGRSERLWPHRS